SRPAPEGVGAARRGAGPLRRLRLALADLAGAGTVEGAGAARAPAGQRHGARAGRGQPGERLGGRAAAGDGDGAAGGRSVSAANARRLRSAWRTVGVVA